MICCQHIWLDEVWVKRITSSRFIVFLQILYFQYKCLSVMWTKTSGQHDGFNKQMVLTQLLRPFRFQLFDTLSEGGLKRIGKKIILWAFQLCNAPRFQDVWRTTLHGEMFLVHRMCLNLLLLNQRADSGSFSFYYPLETYSECYVIKQGKGRERTDSWTKAMQTAVPVQTAVRLFSSKKLGKPQ